MEKFKRDNSGFTQERAEMEVDKFLMDAEMMSAYINYEKRKASGSLREEAEANLSNPRIWATYVRLCVITSERAMASLELYSHTSPFFLGCLVLWNLLFQLLSQDLHRSKVCFGRMGRDSHQTT